MPNSSSQVTTYVISVAADLAGMHPQTLRQYDRLGIVTPQRTAGRGRRYTAHDVDLLREVQRLSQEEGVNLEGIRQILDLRRQVDQLQEQLAAAHLRAARAEERLTQLQQRRSRVFYADPTGEVSTARRRPRPSGALVRYQPPPSPSWQLWSWWMEN